MTTIDGSPKVGPHAVYPVSDLPEDERLLDRDRKAPEGHDDAWGWCAPFCVADGPTNGQTVTRHGPWCTSTSAASVEGHDPQGSPRWLSAALAKLCTHGTYRTEDLRMGMDRHRPLVRLVLDDGVDEVDGAVMFLSIGEVRRLAAGLLFAADTADGLDRDLNGAVAQRRKHREGPRYA